MKVYVDPHGEYAALRHHIVREGDDVVGSAADAELVVRDPTPFPENFVRAVFPSTCFDARPVVSYYFLKIWNGTSFLPQTFLQIPLQGMANGGLGLEIGVGSITVPLSSVSDEILAQFQHEPLIGSLVEISYKGFVSLGYSQDSSVPKGISLGVHSHGMYALAESFSQKISEHFVAPLELKQAWGCALLLTRYPFPFEQEASSIGFDLPPAKERHFWLFAPFSIFKNICSTELSKVGVITRWSNLSLQHAVSMAEGFAWNVSIPRKQFRTDGRKISERVVDDLFSRQIISLPFDYTPKDRSSFDIRGDATRRLEGFENKV